MTTFTNILLPVDTFNNSYLSVQKALDFSGESGTTLHLVSSIKHISLFTILYCRLTGHQTKELRMKKLAARKELWKLKSTMNLKGKSIRFVSVMLIKNNAIAFIKKYMLLQRIDLVIKSPKVDFTKITPFSKPFSLLAPKQTGIPLLIVLGENSQASSRSILIPVNSCITERKVREALWIARKHNAQIHIITVLDDSKPNVKQYIDSFYLTYKLFSDFGHAPQYKIMTGHHKEEIIMHYAQRHNISMIFINFDKIHKPLITTSKKMLRLFQPTEKIHVLPPIEKLKSSA